MFAKMFDKFPNITTSVIVGVIGLPYALQAKQYLYPPKTYEEGKKEGFEQARQEVRNVAKKAVLNTFGNIKGDAEKLKANIAVADKYLQDKVKIALLPQWKLELLGDKYIVRRPLRADWNNAWLMTDEDSHEIDQQIQTVLSGTKFAMDPNKAGLAKGEIQEAIQRIVEDQTEKCTAK